MALRSLPARLAGLPSRLKRLADDQGHDRSAQARGWYKLARWQRLRIRVFARDAYTCQIRECGQVTARRSPTT
jgi:5-methylcytosine-specific restriction protein A